MKVIISIALFLLAYFFLRFGGDLMTEWGGSLLGTTCLLLGLFVWLFEFRREGVMFRSLSRFSYLHMVFFSCFSLFVLALLHMLFWFGPEAAVMARDVTAAVMGFDANDFDGGGVHKKEQDGDTKVVIGNDENSSIQVPKRGGPKGTGFPEVWIHPKNEQSEKELSKGPIYITLKNLLDFDGVESWTVLNSSSETYRKSSSEWTELSDEPSVNEVHYDVSHASDFKLLHAVQGVKRAKVNSLTNYGGVSFSLPLDAETQKPTRTYECISEPKKFTAFSAEQQAAIKIGKGYEEYARNTFSNPLRTKLVDLANSFKSMGLSEPADQINAVKRYLKMNYRYHLDVKNTNGRPPIENFLVYEPDGYCLHFASAGVLLLRELGIPARVSSGYCGGTYFPLRKRWVFYTNNAHAWMEVYLENHGWVVVETTPAQGILVDRAADSGEPEKISTVAERGADVADEMSAGGIMESVFSEARWLLFLIVMMLGALLFIGRLGNSSRSRRKSGGNTDQRFKFDERVYISLYRKMSHANGLPMMDGDTLLAHVRQLEEKGKKPDFADELLEYHYNTVYKNKKEIKAKESSLIKRIRDWKQ